VSAVLDTYVRSQLDGAAVTDASHAGLDARLAAVLEAGAEHEQDHAEPDS
jgi:hypothetical protein